MWYNNKILDLSLKELRLTAQYRNINDYKSLPIDKLLMILNDNKGDRESLFKSKKEESKNIFISQQEIVFLN